MLLRWLPIDVATPLQGMKQYIEIFAFQATVKNQIVNNLFRTQELKPWLQT